MLIAYGTYAMPNTPLEEAAPMLKDIGFDGVEICVGPDHVLSMPEEQDATRRHQLRELLVDLRLGIPALMVMGHLLPTDDENHQRGLEHMRCCVQLARDLGMAEPPIVSMGIGGKNADWESERDRIIDTLGDYDKLAAKEGFILAAEAHCGAAVDRSERALHVIHSVSSPRIRLHFDIVHFYLSGENEAEAVERLLPITEHTHITDARKHEDGSFDLLLLGQGDLDSVAYVKAMDAAGWDDFITLEVSKRVWGQDGYDVEAAARTSYDALTGAFAAAGVERV